MIIAVDIDDVLTNTLGAANEWFNLTYGTNFKIEDYEKPLYSFIWSKRGIITEDVYPIFLESEQFKSLKPYLDAVEGLKELSKKHEIHIITSRQESLTSTTMDWMKKYFSGLYKSITLTNHQYFSTAQQLTKLQVCQKLGADLIIEDNPNFAKECADGKVHAVIMARPWNKGIEDLSHEYITKANSWHDVLVQVEKLEKNSN